MVTATMETESAKRQRVDELRERERGALNLETWKKEQKQEVVTQHLNISGCCFSKILHQTWPVIV